MATCFAVYLIIWLFKAPAHEGGEKTVSHDARQNA